MASLQLLLLEMWLKNMHTVGSTLDSIKLLSTSDLCVYCDSVLRIP